MNRVGVSPNGLSLCDDSASLFGTDRREPLCCPKPRRLSIAVIDSIRPLRWQLRTDLNESRAGADIMDLILAKESYGYDRAGSVASSPPFFCGSPPSRAENPVVQDARFREENPIAASPVQSGFSPSMSPRKTWSTSRSKFGLTQAAVRVEGFDPDRRGRGITAVA
ncbi:hypothetical protein QJS10_CPB12g00345 [Acorus calamus]|uniref:Uncharacterized protein n=1 Tax=Acorus calamus TaxID=4465 RepID=A0AAV9DMJ1_ACOCL|nr:hypothetical protein QJS10_CPB12g00345 [Acorus calamus]